MESKILNIVVSPEVLKSDIVKETYSGNMFGIYSGLTSILSGGTNGESLLTGLTVPLLLTQNYNDIGFYDEFEGFIEQKDVVTNFIISGDTFLQYRVTLYNSGGYNTSSFLELSNYVIDWGDNTSTSQLSLGENIQIHDYPTIPATYTIKLVQNNPFGVTQVLKKITLPFTGVTVDNELGEVTFTQQGGAWSGIPISYDYIFTGDSNTNLSNHLSSGYTQIPFVVSGYTNSKLNLLKRYGPQTFTVGYVVPISQFVVGQVDEITNLYTAYTINNINYVDFPNKTTVFLVNSSGITSNEYILSGLTKNEALMDFVSDPEVQTDIFVERGKYSPSELTQRLGEVDNLGDLKRYGYGYFKFFGT